MKLYTPTNYSFFYAIKSLHNCLCKKLTWFRKGSIVLKMSVEELKIKDELETEVENGLEKEIKDGIYRLALNLHRLYQHKKEKALKLANDEQNKEGNVGKKVASEVNINIKMGGGTTIEIKEIKKRAREMGHRICNPSPKSTQRVRGKMAHPSPRTMKLDWTKSLRSRTNPLSINHETKGSGEIKVESGGVLDSRRGKVDLGIKNALLELGWKY